MRLTTGRPVSIIVLGCLGLLVPLLAVTLPAEAAPKLGPAHRVKGVSDGDTIRVVVKGRSERVRLIGIDTPELGRDGAADQCHAAAARRQMQQLVQGTRVHLVRDSTQSNRDTYGRLLRYVYTVKSRKDVGKALITRGSGREFTFRNSYRHRSAYRSAERSARNAGRGLWGSCGTTAAPAPVAAQPAGQCLIKGNIANDGEKIYDVPGQQYCGVTQIDTSRGERWFCTEPEAVAAGWRRSQV